MKKEPGASEKRGRGRPRSFDRDTVLDRAMRLFWRRGFEAASMSELTAEMGVTAPSVYSTFGDKEGLYLEAVEHYRKGIGSFADSIFAEESTAKRAIGRMLEEAAARVVDPGRPPGCMVTLSAINCSESSSHVQDRLAECRDLSEAAIRARIERGQADGDVPREVDAAVLAGFFATVLHGMSIKARDGATREAMLGAAKLAMKAWPRGKAK